MAKKKKNRQLSKIKFLHKIDPHCCYCGCLTTFEGSPFPNRKGFKPNRATIEHVYTNMDIRRLIAKDVVKIACYKCNHKKGNVDNTIFMTSYNHLPYMEDIDIRDFARKPLIFKIQSFINKNKQTMKTFTIIAWVAFFILFGTAMQCIAILNTPNMENYSFIQWLMQLCYWILLVYMGVKMGTHNDEKKPSQF